MLFHSRTPLVLSLLHSLKEMVFRGHPDIDIFVINSHSSLFQFFFQPLFLPLTILFERTMGLPFLVYIRDAFVYAHLVWSISHNRCFVGINPSGSITDCTIDPYPYLIYITINIIFNLLLLMITKKASAVLTFMAFQAVLPISVILFYIDWYSLFLSLLIGH